MPTSERSDVRDSGNDTQRDVLRPVGSEGRGDLQIAIRSRRAVLVGPLRRGPGMEPSISSSSGHWFTISGVWIRGWCLALVGGFARGLTMRLDRALFRSSGGIPGSWAGRGLMPRLPDAFVVAAGFREPGLQEVRASRFGGDDSTRVSRLRPLNGATDCVTVGIVEWKGHPGDGWGGLAHGDDHGMLAQFGTLLATTATLRSCVQ